MKENIFKGVFALNATISLVALIVGLATTYSGFTIFDSLKHFDAYKGMGMMQSHIVYVPVGSILSGILAVVNVFVSFKFFKGNFTIDSTKSIVFFGILALSSFAIAIATFACVGDLKSDSWIATQVSKNILNNLLNGNGNLNNSGNSSWNTFGNNYLNNY